MKSPDRYAVIGNPVAHSRSPQIHARFAELTGEPVAYDRILAPVGGFASAVDTFRAAGGLGLNVTVPFKIDAFEYAGVHSARAQAAGAVNTLRFDGAAGAGRACVFGDNTDGIGLVNDLQGRLACSLENRRVLLLGAGGAARGVILPLLEAGVRSIVVCNRSVAKARELLALFGDGGRLAAVGYDDLRSASVTSLAPGNAPGPLEIVLNATSSGLNAEPLPVPASLLADAQLAYDMVYAPRPTPFMAQATAAGCRRVSDGLGMLVEQAAESFFIWRGVRPDTAGVHDWLRAEMVRASGG